MHHENYICKYMLRNYCYPVWHCWHGNKLSMWELPSTCTASYTHIIYVFYEKWPSRHLFLPKPLTPNLTKCMPLNQNNSVSNHYTIVNIFHTFPWTFNTNQLSQFVFFKQAIKYSSSSSVKFSNKVCFFFYLQPMYMLIQKVFFSNLAAFKSNICHCHK